jgi:hypothetical protein
MHVAQSHVRSNAPPTVPKPVDRHDAAVRCGEQPVSRALALGISEECRRQRDRTGDAEALAGARAEGKKHGRGAPRRPQR